MVGIKTKISLNYTETFPREFYEYPVQFEGYHSFSLESCDRDPFVANQQTSESNHEDLYVQRGKYVDLYQSTGHRPFDSSPVGALNRWNVRACISRYRWDRLLALLQ